MPIVSEYLVYPKISTNIQNVADVSTEPLDSFKEYKMANGYLFYVTNFWVAKKRKTNCQAILLPPFSSSFYIFCYYNNRLLKCDCFIFWWNFSKKSLPDIDGFVVSDCLNKIIERKGNTQKLKL